MKRSSRPFPLLGPIASLCADRWVLTAGHIVSFPYPTSVVFNIGGIDYTAVEWIPNAKLEQHPFPRLRHRPCPPLRRRLFGVNGPNSAPDSSVNSDLMGFTRVAQFAGWIDEQISAIYKPSRLQSSVVCSPCASALAFL